MQQKKDRIKVFKNDIERVKETIEKTATGITEIDEMPAM